ncbi:MAG: nitroreductase family protein [Methanomassiliicoccales archaeon]
MDVFDAIRARRCVRKFRRDPIPENVLKKVLNAARLAPTVENFQPWKLVLVSDEDIKRKLVSACNNQKCIAEAPLVIVACGLPDEAYPMLGGYMNSYPVDVAMAMNQLMLAATAEGLGTCLITSFKEEKVAEAIGIPSEARIVVITPLGYPAEEGEKNESKNLDELISYNKYA